ncbi:hypothetical protein B0H14DRAFT_3509569 [Mycena olivaceomarginata]|nr:hypothetical protein B0H14DRAFT_3509569 [Mycena olivaceomarginata]
MASATSSEGGHLREEDNDDDWVDDDALDGLATTHRSRNPLAAVIRFRAQKKMARGPNIRATQRKKQASKAKRERAVAEDILKHHASRDAEAEELAEAHNMDVKEVKRRMMAGTKYKQPRKTSSYNALLALIMRDLNEDRPVGSKYRMKDVKAMIKTDPMLKDSYNEQDIKDMQDALDEKKALRSVGVRGSNLAAAVDAKWTIEGLTREITDIATRNNMIGFAIFAKGDLHDTHIPAAIESLGALKFFADVFHKIPRMSWRSLRCGGVVPSTLAELQKACGEIIQLITGKKNIAMNFERYIEAITTIGNLQTLYADLKDGSCKWVKLSKQQQQKIEAEFEALVRSGKRVEKVRQERRNKGQTHQKRKKRVHRRGGNSGSEEEEDGEDGEDEEDENEGDENENEGDKDENEGDEDDEEPALRTRKPSPPPKKSAPPKKPTAPKKPAATNNTSHSKKIVSSTWGQQHRALLHSIMTQWSKVYIVVDALDEYPEDDRQILLNDLASCGTISLMVTSRPHIKMPGQFQNFQNSEWLSEQIRTRPDLRDQIHSKITSAGDGQFLLVKLHIKSLMEKCTIKKVQAALDNLPEDLMHTYDNAMERINKQNKVHKAIAQSTLMWVVMQRDPFVFRNYEKPSPLCWGPHTWMRTV